VPIRNLLGDYGFKGVGRIASDKYSDLPNKGVFFSCQEIIEFPIL
jgi:hypothetical protein